MPDPGESLPQFSEYQSRPQAAAREARAAMMGSGTRPKTDVPMLSWVVRGQPGMGEVGAGKGGEQPAGHAVVFPCPLSQALARGFVGGGRNTLTMRQKQRREPSHVQYPVNT